MRPDVAGATPSARRRILVTGGAGFVGSAVTRRLVDAGARVTVLDDLFTGKAEDDPDRRRVRRGSVTDGALVKELVAEHGLIFHLAARNIIASTAEPARRLRDEHRRHAQHPPGGARIQGRPRRLPSSASVYGNPRAIPINEDDGSWTALALRGEQARRRELLHGVRRELRPAGRPRSATRTSTAPTSGPTTRTAASSRSSWSSACRPAAPVHGDGEQTRDYTYIDDAVDATLLAAVHPRAEGEVFNVGTGIETSVNHLAPRSARLGVEVDVQHVDRRDIDNIRRRVVNIEKIRRMLRWTPQFTLERGLEETAAVVRGLVVRGPAARQLGPMTDAPGARGPVLEGRPVVTGSLPELYEVRFDEREVSQKDAVCARDRRVPRTVHRPGCPGARPRLRPGPLHPVREGPERWATDIRDVSGVPAAGRSIS